jgi:hypothetical protein
MFVLTFVETSRCDSHFEQAFTACSCVFKVITLIGSNQGNYFKNTIACSKRTLKTTVATQLYKLRVNVKFVQTIIITVLLTNVFTQKTYMYQ